MCLVYSPEERLPIKFSCLCQAKTALGLLTVNRING